MAHFISIQIRDSQTRALFDELQFNIQVKIIVGQYMTAFGATKQTVFPYTGFLFRRLSLIKWTYEKCYKWFK